MPIANTDIDIDLVDRDAAANSLTCIPARLPDGSRHKTSVYFQDVPVDPFTNIASIDTKQAAELGYFKIDLLNNSLYQGVRDEDHLVTLSMQEPPWELFEDASVVGRLHHIHNYPNTVRSIRPRSILDLAVVIALIRPGKKHLVGQPRAIIDAEIWKPVQGEAYAFKKSHAVAYAVSIVVQLNLMLEQFA